MKRVRTETTEQQNNRTTSGLFEGQQQIVAGYEQRKQAFGLQYQAAGTSLLVSMHIASLVTDTSKNEKFPIGIFGRESQRHTAENIERLTDMGPCKYTLKTSPLQS